MLVFAGDPFEPGIAQITGATLVGPARPVDVVVAECLFVIPRAPSLTKAVPRSGSQAAYGRVRRVSTIPPWNGEGDQQSWWRGR